MDFLLKLYLAAILLEVQLLFEKETWALEDSLSLPSVYDDMHSGIMATLQLVVLMPITWEWTLMCMSGHLSA